VEAGASDPRLRLLLDEHYPKAIAEQLRARGHDVTSVQERRELSGLSDAEILAFAAAEQRALLTEDVADLLPLATRIVAAGESHFGLLVTSPRSLPRTRANIGTFVRVLDRFLEQHVRDNALLDQIRWLRP
jgi:predicted nuclease of predicted toxin-antitoxin system